MEVNERQLRILNHLLSNTGYVTADELAVQLDVSSSDNLSRYRDDQLCDLSNHQQTWKRIRLRLPSLHIRG